MSLAVPERVLIVDGDSDVRKYCSSVLTQNGLEVHTAEKISSARKLIDKWAFDVVLLDLVLPGGGLQLLTEVKSEEEEVEVVVIAGRITVEAAVEAMRLGAANILPKPFTSEELEKTVGQALEKRRLAMENIYLRQELEKRRHRTSTVSASKSMVQVLEMVERVAPTDSTVLITGESGTGKSMIARRIHELSGRASRPFVAVDCGTLVETLFESELFGHIKGAFTGADSGKVGKFELAHTGTIFFDEIANINLDVQAKLLKAVDDREISKVGSNRTIKVDVRILAATNKDLEQAIERGRFREDLYYRLNVVSIYVPPLRERPEDIPALVDHFLHLYNQERNMNIQGIAPEALSLMVEHDWPGNVRELANWIERLVVLVREGIIRQGDLAFAGWRHGGRGQQQVATGLTLEEMEREHIQKVLNRFAWRKSQTADALGIDRKTLREKIKKYGIIEPQGIELPTGK